MYQDHVAVDSSSEISVKQGDTVGKVETALGEKSPPEGYIKVR